MNLTDNDNNLNSINIPNLPKIYTISDAETETSLNRNPRRQPNPENHKTKNKSNQNSDIDENSEQERKKRKCKGKKKTRRSNPHRTTNNLKIWYNNINGITSKIDEFKTIIDADNPHIIIVTETKTAKCPKLKNHDWINQTKPNKSGGIAMRKDIAMNATEVDIETQPGMEILWCKLINNMDKIYIGAYYGKQENEKLETVEREFSLLTTQIIRLKQDGHIILAGDFNAKIEINDKNQTIQNQSRNGRLLKQTMEMTQTTPITTESNWGKWTRVNRHKTEERSIIDYIVTDQEIAKKVTWMLIDETGNHRPKGKNETDHNTIILEIKIEQKKKEKIK